MKVPTGVILRLTGRRSAIAPASPIPGRTPTRVPRNTPKKHKRRFSGKDQSGTLIQMQLDLCPFVKRCSSDFSVDIFSRVF